MGNSVTNMFLHPNTNVKYMEVHTQFGVSAIAASIQGWRDYMEDYYAMHKLNGEKLFAAVFDGHGGPQVACYASRRLHQQLLNDELYQQQNYAKALDSTFRKFDRLVGSLQGQIQLQNIQKQLNKIVIDKSQEKKISQQVGSTANVLLLTQNKIYVANLGDSRSVLCRSGKAVVLSEDHKPNNVHQKSRIIKAGGYVNHNRINGSINISRTFGDFYYKLNKNKQQDEQMIISVPQITQIERNIEQDQYIILASDGVWEKFQGDNQSLVDSFNQFIIKTDTWKDALRQFIYSLLPQTISQKKTGYDNMSIILVLLNQSRASNTTCSQNN